MGARVTLGPVPKLISPLLAPLLFGVTIGCLLRVHLTERNAFACSCVGDGFWVIDAVTVEGPQLSWPSDGQLYPDSLALWANGFSLKLFYSK
jgi:hypothetical protein